MLPLQLPPVPSLPLSPAAFCPLIRTALPHFPGAVWPKRSLSRHIFRVKAPEDWEEVQTLDALRRFRRPFVEVKRMGDVHRMCDEAHVGGFVRECLDKPRNPYDPLEIMSQVPLP